MSDWDFDDRTRGALASFLRAKGIVDGEITTTPIGDGHSNLTFLVSDGARRVVLRRPPPPPTPPGAHDMLREARFIGALHGTAVPVADLLATAEADEVLDVHFYVMGFAQGPVVTTATPAPLDTPAARREIGLSLVDTLADLHAVDWRAAGLEGLGKPEGFNARHVRRMSHLVALGDGSAPRNFATIQQWLAENAPVESDAAIVHGDYRIGNVVLAPEAPGRVAAVLDWELATIGDPLLDVGYFLSSVPEPDAPLTPTEEFGLAMLEDGYPTRAELATRYAERSGRDLSNLAWYTALALWKVATLYEYGRRRAVRGVGDPYYAEQRRVQSFLEAAHRAAGLDAPAAHDPVEDQVLTDQRS